MHFLSLDQMIIAGTGYTGAGGCEIYAPAEKIIALWDALITLGLTPAGLGARDVLRLEKGYALYGHELSDTIAPTESVAAWAVKLDKPVFLGKNELLKFTRHEFGIELVEKGIARDGYEVYDQKTKIGFVTSGVYSPNLEKSIAIVLSQKTLKIGSEVTVLIRNKHTLAKVVPLPFIPDIYKIWHLELRESSRVHDRKEVNISNMDLFTMIQSRGFGAVQMSNFS